MVFLFWWPGYPLTEGLCMPIAATGRNARRSRRPRWEAMREDQPAATSPANPQRQEKYVVKAGSARAARRGPTVRSPAEPWFTCESVLFEIRQGQLAVQERAGVA